MRKRPTKDLDAAVLRLQRGAPYLICTDAHQYGGSIWGDLEAVLQALDRLKAEVDYLSGAAKERQIAEILGDGLGSGSGPQEEKNGDTR